MVESHIDRDSKSAICDRPLGKKGRSHFEKKEADNCVTPKTLGNCFEVLRYRFQIDVIVGSQYFK